MRKAHVRLLAPLVACVLTAACGHSEPDPAEKRQVAHASGYALATATCLSGLQPIGGGCKCSMGRTGVSVIHTSAPQQSSWVCGCTMDGYAEAYAICGTAPLPEQIPGVPPT